MTRREVRARIEEVALIPAVRVSSAKDALFAAEVVAESGIPIVEITMTVPGAVDVIRELASANAEMIVGAGTIWDAEIAHQCVDAGAKFLTSPGLDQELVHFAHQNDVVVFPGALTPTEVSAAWKAGSDFVKIFPCTLVGGANYIKALKGPFPQIPLVASGGVNQLTALDFILSGAVALGIGTELIPRAAIESRNASWIRELARRFVGMVKQGRSERERPSKTAENEA